MCRVGHTTPSVPASKIDKSTVMILMNKGAARRVKLPRWKKLNACCRRPPPASARRRRGCRRRRQPTSPRGAAAAAAASPPLRRPRLEPWDARTRRRRSAGSLLPAALGLLSSIAGPPRRAHTTRRRRPTGRGRRKGAIAAACARGLCRSRGQGRQHAGHGPRRHARHARGKRPGDAMVDGRPRRTRWTAGGGENRRTSELVAPGGSGRACRSDGQQAGPGPAWWWGDRVMEVRAAPVSQCQPCLSAHRTAAYATTVPLHAH